MSSPSLPAPRPRAVDVAFWLLLVGAVMLLVGGLLAATMAFDTIRSAAPASVSDAQLHSYLAFQRAAGAICVLSGTGLAFLAGRMRRGDARFRRATVVLALVTVVLVALVAVFAGVHILALLGLLPIIAGTVLLTRPAAAGWFAGAGS
jgi:hypothetical protein